MRRVRLAADDRGVGRGQLVDHRRARPRRCSRPRGAASRRPRPPPRRGRGRAARQWSPVSTPTRTPETPGSWIPPPVPSGRDSTSQATEAECTSRVSSPTWSQVSDSGNTPVGGQASERRLEPDHAAQRRRGADTRAGVGAQGQRQMTRGHRRRRARRRAAGDARRVVGVAGRAVGGDVAGGAVGELVGVQLRDDDRSCLAQPRDDRGVGLRWRGVGEHVRAGAGGQARDVEQVLHPDGHPVQRPAPLAAGQLPAQHGGLPQRVLRVEGDHRVVGVGGQTVQHVGDVLGGGELAGAQRHPELEQGRDHVPILPCA